MRSLNQAGTSGVACLAICLMTLGSFGRIVTSAQSRDDVTAGNVRSADVQTGASGSGSGGNAGGVLVSQNGLMRMKSTEIVLGARFELSVMVPPSSDPAEDRQSTAIKWFAAGATDPLTRPGETKVLSGPGAKVVELHAPFDKPGLFEIRLFRCPYYCSTHIDTLRVEVTPGRVAGAIKPHKTSYRPGEPIDVTITPPPNRYYYGHWSGPTVQLVPIRLGTKVLTTEEAAEWLKKCSSCGTWLSLMLKGGRNPHDGGTAADPEMLGKPIQIFMEEMAKTRQIQQPLRAPADLGVYEVRLYDRGFNWEWKSYSDLYIDRQVISVELMPSVTSQPGTPVPDGGSDQSTTTRTGPDGSSKTFTLVRRTDPDGTERLVETAADGHRIETAVSPDGQVVIDESQPGKNHVTTTIAADGRMSTVERDRAGNTNTSGLAPDGSLVHVHRDAKNQVVEIIRDTGDGWTEHINAQGDVRRVFHDAEGRTTTIAVDRLGNTTTTVTDKEGKPTVTDVNVIASAEPGRAYYEQVLKGTAWDSLPKSQKARYAFSERDIQESQERAARQRASDLRQGLEDLMVKAQREGLTAETAQRLAALRAEQAQADRIAAERTARLDRRDAIEQSYDTARRLQHEYDNAIARGDRAGALRAFRQQEVHHQSSMELLRHNEDELRAMQKSSDLRSAVASEIRRRAQQIAEDELAAAERRQDAWDAVTSKTALVSMGSGVQQATSGTTRMATREAIRARASQKAIAEMMSEAAMTPGKLDILQDFQALASLQESAAESLLTSNGRIATAGYAFDAVAAGPVGKLATVGGAALKNTATAIGGAMAKRKAASMAANKTVTLVADDSRTLAANLVERDLTRVLGSDVLPGPAAPSMNFQVTRGQLARWHTPGRNLTATEIVQKAELHRLRHVARNRFMDALERGVRGPELEALRAQFHRYNDLIEDAIEAGRHLP